MILLSLCLLIALLSPVTMPVSVYKDEHKVENDHSNTYIHIRLCRRRLAVLQPPNLGYIERC